MAGFELTNKAKSDLKDIAIYTQNTWGKHQRNIYLTAIDKSFYALAANHLKGRDCGEIRSGYRKHKVGKHIVYYHEINANLIEIARVLHERMDIESHL
ncbi:MAG: type II toxin-antitoxin system RelE/ParE family toxin [Methylococcaceae bacterium]